MSLTVAVVTPTIGSNKLRKCIESVSNQEYKVKHHLFVDGLDYYADVGNIVADLDHENLSVSYLAENVGKGWYGHRVYAACSFLVNEDVVCYLDEDNHIEPNHIKALIEVMEKEQLEWAYSLRKIYDQNGNYLCRDDCESLGRWPVFHNGQMHHIDTSCFAIRREIAAKVGHTFYVHVKDYAPADRIFFANLSFHFQKWNCSGEYSLCYSLGGNCGVQSQFFLEGNEKQKIKYNGEYPWSKRVGTNIEFLPK